MIARVAPATIRLDHDQESNPDEPEATLDEHGHANIRVQRIGAYEPESEELVASSSITKEKPSKPDPAQVISTGPVETTRPMAERRCRCADATY